MSILRQINARSLQLLLLSALFLLPSVSSSAESDDELIILRVFLNAEDKGDLFLHMGADGDIFISSEDLGKMGFHELPRGNIKNSDGNISIKSLAPGTTFSINEKELVMNITTDPELLEKHVVDFSYQTQKNISPAKTNSMYINYQLNYNVTDESSFGSLSVPFETVVRIGDILSYSNFNYLKNDSEEKFTRLFTNFTLDSTSSFRRIIIGDFTASSGTGIGETGILGGISISKNYSLSPYFIKMPRLNLDGILETPSEVEIYVNDTLLSKELLPPGKFEFLNLPTNTSGGKTLMIIRDAYGRETRIEAPFILSADLLKPGINEYSYNLGFTRRNFGTKSQDYGDLSFMFFHRLGITRYFTAGMRGEGDKNRWNFGPSVNLLIGRFGQLDSSVAISDYLGQKGYGSIFHLRTSFWRFFVELSYNAFSKGYSSLLSQPASDSTKTSGLGSIGFSSQWLGSITASVNIQKTHDDTERQDESISYNRFISRYFSLFINARRTESPTKEDVILVGLNFFSEGTTMANMEYQHQKESEQYSVNVQKSQQNELGTSYNLRGITNKFKNNETQNFIDAGVRHLGTFGNLSFNYTRSSDVNNYFFKYAGSLSFLNKRLYISRPIFDSFAVVEVGRLKGVDVLFQNVSVGKTGRDGTIVIPGITSYNPVSININPDDIPIEYSIPKTEEHIMLPYRSGTVVKFPASRLVSFEGTLALKKDGKKEIAEYGTLYINTGKEEEKNEQKEIIIGQGGMFYFENIPPGKFEALLKYNGNACGFILKLPDTGEIITDLGEITCEMETISPDMPADKVFEKIWGDL